MDITLDFSFDLAINRDGPFQVVGAKPQNRAKTALIGVWLVRCIIGLLLKVGFLTYLSVY
jgi:hypothetical protein